MSWYWWTAIGIYVLGFLAAFVFNASIGPVTLGLAIFRALVWPIWLLTGRPQGEVQGFD